MDNALPPLGTFSWCELLTSDLDAAKTFYGQLFNWSLEPAPNTPPEINYTLAKVDGKPIAGLMSSSGCAENVPSHWGNYITVADVDTTVAQALAMGATVCVPAQDIPQVGRFSILQDPQGAAFGIISYLPMHCG